MDSIQKCTMEAVSSLELEQVTEYKDIQLIGCVISPKNLLLSLLQFGTNENYLSSYAVEFA